MSACPDRIVVTATGIISALGTGLDAHLSRVRGGLSGLRHPVILRTRHAAEFVVGEVRHDNAGLMRLLSLDEQASGYTRTSLLSMCAIQDLLMQVDVSLLRESRLAFINANTVGGMSEVENLYMSFIDPASGTGANGWIDTLDCAESTEHVARFFGLEPQMATISTACSSSANAMIVAARMLCHGMADFAIAGGGDALSRFTLNGFNSLKNIDREACKPFDAARNGLNLGEGAGYVLLERERDAQARNAPILAVLSGWDNANDAYHPTAPAPDGSGAMRTMLGSLRKAGLEPEQIGYVNAHGTATLNNDAAEGKAISELWEGTPPPCSSTKPFTGHTLAAAGVVEAIITIGAMKQGFVPPNLNWSTPMEEVNLVPAREAFDARIDHAMSNSFGFGGNNVSLIFSRA